MQTCLSLKDLTLKIHLGVTAVEQQQLQAVVVDIDIFFKSPPQACITDDLHQALCYDDLAQKIAAFCAGKSFHLIEYFGYQLFDFLKNVLSLPSLTKATATNVAMLSVGIKKTPPIANLGRAIFTLNGDLC